MVIERMRCVLFLVIFAGCDGFTILDASVSRISRSSTKLSAGLELPFGIKVKDLPFKELFAGVFAQKEAEVSDTVFFDISVGEEKLGRVEMGLYGEVCPKTTENFKQLCTGEQGFGYKGSNFKKILQSLTIHGGDFDGKGGRAVCEGGEMEHENYTMAFGGKGTLAMINSGPNTYGSQFFVTLSIDPPFWLNGKHTVFGKVTDGLNVLGTVNEIAKNGQPIENFIIKDCGVL